MNSELEYRYTVCAYSSFHLMRDAEKYVLGEFGDCASAVAACKKIVDDFLLSIGESGNSPETLLEEYASSGPEPYVESDDPACWFSADRPFQARGGQSVRHGLRFR